MTYDENNIFARLLRGELPFQKVYEDAFTLAFHDRFPKAPLHVLIIPKGPYVSAADFYAHAPQELVVGFSRGVAAVIDQLDVTTKGFRLITNTGADGGQEVPHFHLHLLAGRPLGPLVSASSRPTA
jgi:diadenosine tetraphosphate (Ap4A) HIT family hydrolase